MPKDVGGRPRSYAETRRFWAEVSSDNKRWLRDEASRSGRSMTNILMAAFIRTRGYISLRDVCRQADRSTEEIWSQLPRDLARDIRVEAIRTENSISGYTDAMISRYRDSIDTDHHNRKSIDPDEKPEEIEPALAVGGS